MRKKASSNPSQGSSREQAATAIMARQLPLVVAGSFSNIFARNSINNALLGLEVPRLVERLRAAFPSSDKVPTRRTGWTLTWDISRSVVKVQEGEGGEVWEEKVGQFSENLQRDHRQGGVDGMGQSRDRQGGCIECVYVRVPAWIEDLIMVRQNLGRI